MSEARRHTFGSRFLTVGLLLWLTASLFAQTTAQERASQMVQRSSLTITASAAGDRVRIAAPASVVQMRLEVYGAGGEKFFDQEIRGGNVFDWHVQDGQAQRLAAGTYICVVTAKNISGKLTQKMGTVIVEEKSVSVQPADSQQLSVQQAQTIGPVEENPSWTIPGKDEQQTTTVIAHDGTDGQLTRGRGALSFRIGDFFTGNDLEQMRLTEEGNLGIGTDNPRAKLDVAGDISARGTVRTDKVEFADGTVQTTGLSGRKDKDGNLVPNVAGTGTQNRLAKWTDNSGTLGDAAITETGGKLGVGTASPNYEITLFGNDVGLQLISAVTGATANDGFRFGISSTNNAFLWNAEATDMYFGTSAAERMRITSTGNVGIGTTSPGAKLHVNGAEEGVRIQGPAAGASNQAYATFYDAAGTRTGYVGDGSTGDNDVFLDADLGNVTLNTSAGRVLTATSSGNVGIGTTLPQAKLDVRGDVKLGGSGQFFAPGGEENLRIIRGVIDANGNIIVGAGFTATLNPARCAACYTITFNTSFAGAPAVTATVAGPNPDPIDIDGATASTVGFIVGNEPRAFHFIAIGPR